MDGTAVKGDRAPILSARPFFSVITVCYNNLAGLKETMASLSGQTCADYEWLVIDGASSDGTPSYLAALADSRLVSVSERDGGIYDAMEKGLARATGDYVIFMNAGDIFADADVLANVRALVGEKLPVLIYGDSYERDGMRRFYKASRSPAENSYVMFTHHQSIFYRRDVARQTGFDHSYRMSCDWVMTGRILAAAGEDILYFPAPVSAFERGGVSQSGRMRATFNSELFRIYREEHHHPLPKAIGLWAKKVAVNRIRMSMPGLYDRLRYRRGQPAKG